jgi:hypothetical protein
LEGSDPSQFKGTTVNGMSDFQEPVLLGPEYAQWNTLGSYTVDGVRYRFIACARDATRADASCLAASTDGGKTWEKIAGSPTLAPGGKFGAPNFISFGELEFFLGKPGEYVYAAAYAGVVKDRDNYIVGRVPKAKLARANAADWSFQQRDYTWGSLNTAGESSNTSSLGPDGANWKTMNSYSVDGTLYMFVTRCSYPWKSNDPKGRHVFHNSSIIKSTDQGRTWMRSSDYNYQHPMFPGQRFGAPYFVWYGKDGAGSADNAGGYVYAVSNNGHFENGDDYVLGRVLRSKLADLSPADWSFYQGGNGMQQGGWTSSLDRAKPILTIPGRAGMTGMTYIEALHRYVLVAWHYHQDSFVLATKAQDLGTVLEFFEAPTPWGAWTKVKTLASERLGWYAPVIGQRFQTVVNANTVSAFLYAAGLYTKPEGGLGWSLYKFNYIPITLSTEPLQHNDPVFVGGK